jgi:hypothetical protein
MDEDDLAFDGLGGCGLGLASAAAAAAGGLEEEGAVPPPLLVLELMGGRGRAASCGEKGAAAAPNLLRLLSFFPAGPPTWSRVWVRGRVELS